MPKCFRTWAARLIRTIESCLYRASLLKKRSPEEFLFCRIFLYHPSIAEATLSRFYDFYEALSIVPLAGKHSSEYWPKRAEINGVLARAAFNKGGFFVTQPGRGLARVGNEIA